MTKLNRPTVICASLIGVVLLACSFSVAWHCVDSDMGAEWLIVMLGAPLLVILSIISFVYTGEALLKKESKLSSVLALYAGIGLLAYAVYQVTTACLLPSTIRLGFSYPGNTGSYHSLQVYFLQDGRWLEGPTVEGWPMRVSFPDLNHDGHLDLRVTETFGQRTVEFVYLVKNDGHCFWHAIKNDTSLTAIYAPDHYCSNCN